jgi:hypothetical protein
MQKNIRAVIITPDNYSSAGEFPLVYLLKGYSRNHLDWINKEKGRGNSKVMIITLFPLPL